MNQLRRQFPVWGTIVDVDCYSQSVGGAELDRAMDSVIEFCEDVDRDFSTYKDGSWVSWLRAGKVGIVDCPNDVQAVWELCLRAKNLSDGAFDPWAVDGGFDPSTGNSTSNLGCSLRKGYAFTSLWNVLGHPLG